MTTDHLLEEATGRHRAGDLVEARRLYAQILEGAPDHTTALFRLGLLELQAARPESALPLLQRVATAAPTDARHHIGLGQVCQSLGQLSGAADAYRRALAIDPESSDVHFALGSVLQSLGNYAGAIAAYERAVELQPGSFAALNNLGNCLQRGGHFHDAAAAYTRALEIRPDEPGAMANLGTVLQDIDRPDEAIALLRAAVALEPTQPAHAVNLGIALCRRREFAAAEGILRDALEQDPHSADAAFNLGNALHGLGRSDDAADLYGQALHLRPDFVDASINLGNMHREMGQFTAAAACFEAALTIQPDSVVAMNNAGALLRTLGRFDEAEEMLRRGLQLNPRHAALYDNLGSVLKDVGELDAAIDCFRQSLSLEPNNPATHSNLAYAQSFQAAQPLPVLEECLRWNSRFAAVPRLEPQVRPSSPSRRLRVGYVSPDFREHCQTLFTTPLLSHHDHAEFEIYCYSSVERPDEQTRRLAGYADVWREVRSLDDAALAERIRADRIDILVDLTMHMARGRLLAFARKPAPIQVAWLAYPGTTGIGAMDFRISDPRLDPAGFDDHYSERTIRLPDSFWCYDPLATDPKVNPLPALERGYVTLGCLNNPCKLTDRTLRLWSRVMQSVPTSRLRLLAPSGRHGQRVVQRLTRQGIGSHRVELVPYRARAEYLRYYHDIDLGLDTFPYNGHTTSLDSLWMGVPTVTRVGATSVGRGGLSQLFHLGLTELSADTDDAFVATAVELCENLQKLARLRTQLRARLEQSPLMDGQRFARQMESAYRHLWQHYTASAALESIG
jgi:predicted O-linked N-acetylglucosamine transferase (SPINDLY family)